MSHYGGDGSGRLVLKMVEGARSTEKSVRGWPKLIGGRWDFEVGCAKDSNLITG